MDDSFARPTNNFSTKKYTQRKMQSIFSKVLVSAILILGTYSSASLADYNIWYDSETFQEHQIYDGNTLLVPPSWACGRKFSNPSYYRHLDNYYNTLDSADFWKDIYVWIPKAGCPSTSESFIEYVDGSQYFSPPLGAIGIEISTNYGSQWVDANGSWPSCATCANAATDFVPQNHDWGGVYEIVSTLKLAVIKKDFVKFNDAAIRTDRLLTSLERKMDYSIQEANSIRSRSERYRLANIEGTALNQLSMARKQLDLCIRLASSSATLSSAYPSCDAIIANLEHSKSLWQSRN